MPKHTHSASMGSLQIRDGKCRIQMEKSESTQTQKRNTDAKIKIMKNETSE
jgi:hypothetical protein